MRLLYTFHTIVTGAKAQPKATVLSTCSQRGGMPHCKPSDLVSQLTLGVECINPGGEPLGLGSVAMLTVRYLAISLPLFQ